MDNGQSKILFVDDDNFLRKVYETELVERGYAVILAADGEEGLQKAQSEDPDLIILDMIMPKKNGFEVLTELQANPATASIPVIILSNLGQEADIKKGKDLGAVEYLVKDNITLGTIVDKVSEYLHSKTKSKQALNGHGDAGVAGALNDINTQNQNKEKTTDSDGANI